MMVCVYSALAYDAKNLPSRQGVKFEPSTFLQVRAHFPPTPNFCEHSDVAVHSDDVRRHVNHHLEAVNTAVVNDVVLLHKRSSCSGANGSHVANSVLHVRLPLSVLSVLSV
jgi:hypothetical protein